MFPVYIFCYYDMFKLYVRISMSIIVHVSVYCFLTRFQVISAQISFWYIFQEMDLCYKWKCFQTTSVVPFPSDISKASRVWVCFSHGALITPAGSAFSFSSAIPLPTRCQVPLGSVMSPRLLYWCGFPGSCMWHGQGDVLVSVLAPENIFRQHVFTNMISASAYAFWLSHIVFFMCFCLLVSESVTI